MSQPGTAASTSRWIAWRRSEASLREGHPQSRGVRVIRDHGKYDRRGTNRLRCDQERFANAERSQQSETRGGFEVVAAPDRIAGFFVDRTMAWNRKQQSCRATTSSSTKARSISVGDPFIDSPWCRATNSQVCSKARSFSIRAQAIYSGQRGGWASHLRGGSSESNLPRTTRTWATLRCQSRPRLSLKRALSGALWSRFNTAATKCQLPTRTNGGPNRRRGYSRKCVERDPSVVANGIAGTPTNTRLAASRFGAPMFVVLICSPEIEPA